ILEAIKTPLIKNILTPIENYPRKSTNLNATNCPPNIYKRSMMESFCKYENEKSQNPNPNTLDTIREMEPLVRTFFDPEKGLLDQEQLHYYRYLNAKILARNFIEDIGKDEYEKSIAKIVMLQCDIQGENLIGSIKKAEIILASLGINKNTFGKNKKIEQTIIEIFISNYNNHNNNSSKILRALEKNGLNLNMKEITTNGLIHATHSLISAHDLENGLEAIKYLLETHQLNPNLEIFNKRTEQSTTPFCYAVGLFIPELVNLFLSHGANPIFVGKTIKFDTYPCHAEKFNEQRFNETVKIIEQHMLLELEKSSQTKPTETPTNDYEDDRKISADDSKEEEKESTEPENLEIKTNQTINELIDFKEKILGLDLSEEINFRSEIDILLLKYINQPSNREELQQEIKTLLDEYPECSNDYLSLLIDRKISINDAELMLQDKPQLLHKFFSIKKEESYSKNLEFMNLTKDEKLKEGIYEIETNPGFKTRCFFKIDYLDHGIQEEKLQKLSFIRRGSIGENGIKKHENYLRLKVDNSDKSFYATKAIVDESSKYILYTFDLLLNHEEGEKLINGHTSINLKNVSHDYFICELYHQETDGSVTLAGEPTAIDGFMTI
ncbi:MAG: hypothetical protein KA998_02240, partial [Rickettsiaceae bacterium]|nr:hypothetical protein [Rickettsiaceae bacterium]